MAKKLGKLLALSAVIGAAAGAVYYYKSKEKKLDEIDDFDDFEDFEEDDELEQYLKEEAMNAENTERSIRDFVPITLSRETVEEAKATIKRAAEGFESRAIDAVTRFGNVVKPDSSSDIEEFEFDDLEEDEVEDAVAKELQETDDVAEATEEPATTNEDTTETEA